MAPVVPSNRISIKSSNNSSKDYSKPGGSSCVLDDGDLIPSINVTGKRGRTRPADCSINRS